MLTSGADYDYLDGLWLSLTYPFNGSLCDS